jgi:hypothetical protein
LVTWEIAAHCREKLKRKHIETKNAVVYDIRETVVNNLNVSSDEENPAAVQNKAMGKT